MGPVIPEIDQISRSFLFGKCIKFNMDFKTVKKKKKIEKKYFVFEIIASELVALNCPY